MTELALREREQLTAVLSKIEAGQALTEATQNQLLTVIDSLSRKAKGLPILYEHIDQLVGTGLLKGTNWEFPSKLVPSLVKGTLISGFPTVSYEIVSELRLLAIAEEKFQLKEFDSAQASNFLQEAIISGFTLAFGEATEEIRMDVTATDRKRLRVLFRFLMRNLSSDKLKAKLAEEVKDQIAHRPILTHKLEQLLSLIKSNFDLKGHSEVEEELIYLKNALFHPTLLSLEVENTHEYAKCLPELDEYQLINEATTMGEKMNATGLVSKHQVVLLHFLRREKPELIPLCLHLSDHGRADFSKHITYVFEIIDHFVWEESKQVAYGLAKLLNRSLLSRKAVRNALYKFFRIKIHPQIAERLKGSSSYKEPMTPEQLLSGGMIKLLGQPLGVGQGLNPTCQSARGLSMWSQHSPEKLINLVIDAATQNQLVLRYEGEIISSKGSAVKEGFDFNLDPISVVTVPHLDHIYQQMMRRAAIKHPTVDPHVSVNPAFYGHWIQTGFISCYNPLQNAIDKFDHFVKLFYAAFHPQYNGGFKLVYPIPIGIFITSSHGEFLGFHAISLLRVRQDQNQIWRAYFFNPNNEGRQDWGQGIKPSVSRNGEKHGESSLPFDEFLSRVYAYHYNSLEAENHLDKVEQEHVTKITSLARESWGKKYIWI